MNSVLGFETSIEQDFEKVASLKLNTFEREGGENCRVAVQARALDVHCYDQCDQTGHYWILQGEDLDLCFGELCLCSLQW